MDRLIKNLNYIAKKLFSVEEYEKFLELAAKFPNLSIYNILLLYHQMPNATLIAGENAWRDNYNLEVKENEKAICMIRPSLDENEVLGYSQIGVFDISQLEKEPEIKKEKFDIAYAIHETTGYMWSYPTEDMVDMLEDIEYFILGDDAEIIIKEHKEMNEEEKENHVNAQLLKFYIEDYLGLSETDHKQLAMMQGAEYILSQRYGLNSVKINQAVLSNCKEEGLQYFIDLLDFTNQIINEIENRISVEFNFAETAFVDLLLDTEDKEESELIAEYAIEDDDRVLDKMRDDFIEKLEFLSHEDYNKMLEDRQSNKMMTQPPYRVKLIADV